MLDLYLHRGSFETVIADEDAEQESDRWVSHRASGRECWQILSQWVWNLRLELGQHLSPTTMRLTEFASASAEEPPPVEEPSSAASVVYGPLQWARTSFTGGFSGTAFTLQPDGTLRCPANHPLYPQERRPERDGSYRLLYAARIRDCCGCSLRAQCPTGCATRCNQAKNICHQKKREKRGKRDIDQRERIASSVDQRLRHQKTKSINVGEGGSKTVNSESQ